MRMPRIRRRRSSAQLRRGIFLLPSLFTVGNTFCGFLSLIESSRGHMSRAAVLIMIAIVADILDGRIARLTGTTTSFGATYDSLADVISFGAAPALLAYHWGLKDIPRAGMAIAFLFVVAGSIRLARFSTTTHDSTDFKGLPIPAGAAGIALPVLVSPQPVQHPLFLPVVAGFVFALSLLMVSNLPYRSFKDLTLRRQWPAPALFVIALLFSLIFFSPQAFLSLALGAYILLGPILGGRKRRRRITEVPGDEPGAEGEADGNSDRNARSY